MGGAFKGIGTALDGAAFGIGEAHSWIGEQKNAISRKEERQDPTAHRSYLEDGFIRNIRPQVREITWQAPDITVVVKKRLFSSLAESYKLDLLEEKEILFYRASKKLFQNKAKALAAYERLSKIEDIVNVTGRINSHIMPTLLSSVAALEDQGVFNLFDSNTQCAIQRLRTIDAFSNSASFSQWWVEPGDPFSATLGAGTGTFDLTVMSRVSTDSSVELGRGECRIAFENPYDIMIVTDQDIARAITEATNFTENSGEELERVTEDLIQTLNNLRLGTRQGSFLSEELGLDEGSAPNQPPISFTLQPTFQTHPVRARIDLLGITIPYEFIPGLLPSVNVPPIPQLTDEERGLVETIIGNYITLIDLRKVQQFNAITFNKNHNYVRRKLSLHYEGKPIVQPMDIVNVFISSYTKEDSAITQGFGQETTGGTLATKVDTIIGNLKKNFGQVNANGSAEGVVGQVFNGQVVTQDELEKIAVAGPGFPDWMWRQFKGALTTSPEGIAVFVGIAQGATDRYSEQGSFELTVNCKDNSAFFNQTQVNFNPSLTISNGDILDPLTPFDISFDASTGAPMTALAPGEMPPLLGENSAMLKTGVAKVNTGRWRGQGAITEDIFNSRDGDISGSSLQEVLATPAGFVYRWKEGIGGWFGTEEAAQKRFVQPRIVSDPFAGQDVMNALSLLIVGQPYNFNLFLQNAMNSVLTSADGGTPQSNTERGPTTSKTFLENLLTEIRRFNTVWGNFLPFKSLVINPAAESAILTQQAGLVTQNMELSKLLTKQSNLVEAVITGGATPSQVGNKLLLRRPDSLRGEGLTPTAQEAILKLGEIQDEIDTKTQAFINLQAQVNSANLEGGFKILGNNILYDPKLSPVEDTSNSVRKSQGEAAFRKRLGFLTLRRLWQVRANVDKNYFIVDDQYDKNRDVQGFERKVTGDNMRLFESEYTNVAEKIKNAGDVMGLEVFCNTQGHMVARPPLYNRIPSSVLFELFKQRDETGIQFFPDFFLNLFTGQGTQLLRNLEILETQIRIIGVILGFGNSIGDLDREMQDFLSSYSEAGVSFEFITFLNNNWADVGLEKIFANANPDLKESTQAQSLKQIQALGNELASQARAKEIFAVTSQFDAFAQSVKAIALGDTIPSEAQGLLKVLASKFLKLTGEKPRIDNWTEEAATASGRRTLISTLADFLTTRQQVLVSAANVIKNIQELAAFNKNPQKAVHTAMFPSLNSESVIPPVIEHMMELENNDELGPRSGQRYVIRDVDIISWDFSENAPDYNTVLVSGNVDTLGNRIGGQVEPHPGLAFKTLGGGGNLMTTAMAVDYDMWRMYGLKTSQAIPAPFFVDAEAQCLPYAVFLLNLQRKKIFKGSISVRGNEYYQPGDVVYVESRGMLFYVNSVNHQLGFNRSFTTTLTLEYGRKPGEFIPTMLDMIGQLVYAPTKLGQVKRNSRDARPSQEQLPLGAIGIPTRGGTGAELATEGPRAQSQTIEQLILEGPMGARNQSILQNALAGISANAGVTNKSKDVIYIRTFSSKRVDNEGEFFELTNQGPVIIKKWLLNPKTFCENENSLITDNNLSSLRLQEENIKIVHSFLEDEDVFAFSAPISSSAWGTARLLLTQTGAFGQIAQAVNACEANVPSANELLKTLVTQVIELWLVHEPVITTTEDPQSQENDSQNANEEAAATEEARRNATEGTEAGATENATEEGGG